MIDGYSSQYRCRCIILNKQNDPPAIDQLIERCRDVGAIYYEDGPVDECFVVDVGRGVGPELWTERALRGSWRAKETAGT